MSGKGAVLDFGLKFESSAVRLKGEAEGRRALVARELKFGINFLDDALGGILPHDLIIVGARTGAGKSQLASIIAQMNAAVGKRVHYFALEAEPLEIERRLKYRCMVGLYYDDAERVSSGTRFSYRDWYRGKLDQALAKYEEVSETLLAKHFKTLVTYYRGAEFNVDDIERLFMAIQDQTDLVILDHLHYVDSDDPNENRAYKTIVKKIRDVSLSIGKPVIVIAHLRKKDRGRPTVMPDIDDFHGSSDITKIATKCILLAPGQGEQAQPYLWDTYMTIAKDRMDGYKPQVALLRFDARLGVYGQKYELGKIKGDKWEEIDRNQYPHWAR